MYSELHVGHIKFSVGKADCLSKCESNAWRKSGGPTVGGGATLGRLPIGEFTSLVWDFGQGTKLLFYDSKSDVLLLDIPNTIPDNFQAYKVGFDASEDVPSRAVSIHHPGGNIKRISYANST